MTKFARTVLGVALATLSTSTETLAHENRRVTVVVVDDGQADSVQVLWEGEGSEDPQRSCVTTAGPRWECRDVPVDERLLVAADTQTGVAWSIVPAVTAKDRTVRLDRASRPWGKAIRLIGAGLDGDDDDGDDGTGLEVRASLWVERPQTPGVTTRRIRLVRDPDAVLTWIGPTLAWLHGRGSTERRHLEIRGASVASTRVSLAQLVGGPVGVEFHLLTQAPVDLDVTVETDEGDPVPDAEVAVFDLVPDTWPTRTGPPEEPQTFTHPLGEARSDSEGRARFRTIEAGRYELVAIHPTAGRVTETRLLDGRPVRLTMAAGHRGRGRVWFEGEPAAGAAVSAAPDHASIEQATDPLDHAAPGAIAAADGRFELSLPPAGSGTLLVAHAGAAHLRRPYDMRGTGSGSTELGDLVLSPLPTVRITVIGGACALQAVGPVGQSSMTLLEASPVPGLPVHLLHPPEPGFWWLSGQCGEGVARLVPQIIQVPAGETHGGLM